MKESQNIEYNEIWKDEYLKWIAGFANAASCGLYNVNYETVEFFGSKKSK